MPSSLISLGANLGNVLETIRAAGRMLHEAFPTSELRFSSIIRTPPVGGPEDQSDFLNAIARVDHRNTPWEVWEKLKQIESNLGRRRFQRWESRRIDMDLILHEDLRIWTPHFKIPHPRMCMRTFVLHPATQVGPELIDPVTGCSIQSLGARLRVSHAPRIAVLCNTESFAIALEHALDQRDTIPHDSVSVLHCPDPQQWSNPFQPNANMLFPNADRGEPGAALVPDLCIACVETPEPETVLWEDFSLPWARALNLVPYKPEGMDARSASSLAVRPQEGTLVRYLMPGNDLDWVCHEIEAALIAMRCPLEFTDYSWNL